MNFQVLDILDQKEPPDDAYYFELFPGLMDTGSIYHFMLR